MGHLEGHSWKLNLLERRPSCSRTTSLISFWGSSRIETFQAIPRIDDGMTWVGMTTGCWASFSNLFIYLSHILIRSEKVFLSSFQWTSSCLAFKTWFIRVHHLDIRSIWLEIPQRGEKERLCGSWQSIRRFLHMWRFFISYIRYNSFLFSYLSWISWATKFW